MVAYELSPSHNLDPIYTTAKFPTDPGPIYGVLAVAAGLAYMLFGVSSSQIIWYFRSYPGDPSLFRVFVAVIWSVDTANFVLTVFNVHYTLIGRGIGENVHTFLYCANQSYLGIMVTTELCCTLVELFFIIRMWRFAERKRLALLGFIPYTLSGVFNLVYIVGMFRAPCYPEMNVNIIWLILSYGFKIVTDGIIAGVMSWLLSSRSKGIRRHGGMTRAIRALIYWSVSTGLLLWVSTMFHLFTYIFLPETYVAPATYMTRSRVYLIAMMAVINDRKRCQEVIKGPESISLRISSIRLNEVEESSGVSHFWMRMAEGSLEPDCTGTNTRCSIHHSVGLET